MYPQFRPNQGKTGQAASATAQAPSTQTIEDRAASQALMGVLHIDIGGSSTAQMTSFLKGERKIGDKEDMTASQALKGMLQIGAAVAVDETAVTDPRVIAEINLKSSLGLPVGPPPGFPKQPGAHKSVHFAPSTKSERPYVGMYRLMRRPEAQGSSVAAGSDGDGQQQPQHTDYLRKSTGAGSNSNSAS
jgi:hypothetical protein